jgi:acetyl-CoA C-acetyltransferase
LLAALIARAGIESSMVGQVTGGCVSQVSLQSVDVNRGAIALGHPLGATGGVLLTKCLNELERTGGRYGLVTMRVGGGMGTATLIERL